MTDKSPTLYDGQMTREPIKQQTVVAQVMEEIRNLIASGAYRPGEKIPTEKELADQFSIGRSSIREAIKIFNYLGVLESRAALGTFVQERSSISTEALTWSLLLGNDEIEDIIEFRGAIELWCLVKLVDDRSGQKPEAAETISRLEEIVERMGRASRENDRELLIDYDYRFHHEIIRSSASLLFISIYETLKSFLQDEIRKSQNDYEDTSQIYREHDHLLDSIKTGRKSRIMVEYIAHIENIKNRMRSQRG